MNYTLFLLIFSISIFVISLVVICISPIINNITINNGNWSFSRWRTLNCKYFQDRLNSDEITLDNIQKYKKLNSLCNRKKAMHDLESTSLIIDVVLGFLCANLSLLHFLNVGKHFEKKTGIIGLVTGIIGFIITLIYVCYNGYIFNNDIAYGEYDITSNNYIGYPITKKFSNGGLCKLVVSTYITPYENEKDDFAKYIKFKDLGKKQYNYDNNYYQAYYDNSDISCYSTSCPSGPLLGATCKYIYPVPVLSNENKDLYDQWLTTLILGVFLVILNIGLSIFGFLLFKNAKESTNDENIVKIL